MKSILLIIFVWLSFLAAFVYVEIYAANDYTDDKYIIHDTIENKQNLQIDTISYIKTIDSLQTVINDIQLDIDKYQTHTDSIADELLVAQYKLKRIEYYVSISKGTNSKYLRGWILRVLED